MGCILSEVITWVTEGRKKLWEYRRRRLEEVGENCFHCNGEVLDTVNQLHEELKQNHRRHDYVTPKTVELLVHCSIVIDHNSRASAHHLSHQCNRILKEAQQKLDRGRSVSDGALDTKKRLPPNFPPRPASTWSAGTLEVETENCHLGQLSGHRPRSTHFQRRDTHNEWVQNATIRKPVHSPVGRNGNRNLINPLERSQHGHPQAHLAHRRPEHVSSQPVSSNMQRQQCARSSAHKAQIEMRSQHIPLGIITDTYGDNQAPYPPLRR